MADEQPTPSAFSLSLTELQSLVDRLRARAVSTMFPDMPLLKGDLSLAAAALKAFMKRLESDERLELNGNG
jgi:hypothetical protein